MSIRLFVKLFAALGAGTAALMVGHVGMAGAGNAEQMVFRNAAGHVRTITADGEPIDVENPFFQDLGTNGRRCVTCHQPGEAWTITPEGVQRRFAESNGTDPIFRNNDGSNCEGALSSSFDEQRTDYSLLLTRGLIRVGLDIPDDAEFTIDDVTDPYGCGQTTNDVSVHRRPLPSTNVRFLSAVMWDGRESLSTSTIADDLRRQANNATRGHAQASRDITQEQARQIAEFQAGLFTAQSHDAGAGALNAGRARGGPAALSRQPFFIGINDPVGLNPTGTAFDPNAFTLFDAWSAGRPTAGPVGAARQAIVRGQAIFNTNPITLTGVSGLNGETFSSGTTVPASLTGTCTVCHDSPNVGHHSVKAPLDIGLTDPSVAPYLPVYTLRNIVTGETVRTTDPGRALITGKWRDVNRFKGPILRGLAARAPYFHNGAALTLREVVEFYDTRFSMGLTPREKADLEAFLRSL
jgi:cytochrome c peroxidase